MSKKYCVLDAVESYKDSVLARKGFKPAQTHICRFQSVFYRVLVPGLGGPKPSGAQITKQERQKAQEYLASQPISRLREVRKALHKGYNIMGTPLSSQRNYSPLVLVYFLSWAEVQYPHVLNSSSTRDFCPKMHKGLGGGHSMPRLTERRGRYLKCGLEIEEISEQLRQVLTELEQYSLTERYAGRVTKKLKRSSHDRYRRYLLLFAGLLSNRILDGIAPNQLTLQHLCPHLTEDDFDELSRSARRKLEKQHARDLEHRLNECFKLQAKLMGSNSPATRANYITALIWIFRFIYRDHVRTKSDYQQFEVGRMLREMLNQALREKEEWRRKERTALINPDDKYPDFEEQRTGIEIVQQDICLVLLLELAVRNRWGTFRQPRGIATSYQRFILYFLLSFMPARRQQDLRSLKIANACQLSSPPDVPEGGCVFPLPPNSEREKDGDGFPVDNFLIHVYEYKDKSYPEGAFLWILDEYKTVQSLGSVVLEIPNYPLGDERCFYDCLWEYLCGVWTPRVVPEAQLYQGHKLELQGHKGIWATKGRMEFSPCGPEELGDRPGAQHAWHYLLLQPRRGTAYNATSLGRFFRAPAYRMLGKQLTPHIMRHLWATWGYRKKLTDHEIESLAFAMGHSADTLRNIYQRITQEERLEPLQDILRSFYQQQGGNDDMNSLESLKSAIRMLSLPQRSKLKAFLAELEAS